jgi:eukaryotic-like serine/threonine-protein kinase
MPELLTVATQIASALAAAHRLGIVHRDLKPANVMLTRAGAKLLDFGLAKLRADDVGILEGLTQTVPLTGRGQILGTLHYMAPEQLEGRPVDPRTDLFAFGLIVYEMATGRRAFEGASPASLIGAILHTTPPALSSVARDVPPGLERLLTSCLAKDADDRWSSAHDVLLQLKSLGDSAIATATPSLGQRRRERLAWTLAAAAGVGALALATLAFTGRLSTPREAAKLEVLSLLPPLDSRLEYGEAPQISPNGRHIAFVATDRTGRSWLYLRSRDKDDARPLPETDEASMPFWSPDSRQLGFFAQGNLKTVSVHGGSPHALAPAPVPRGGTWNRDGVILFVPLPAASIMRISAAGGTATPITNVISGRRGSFPKFLPDGHHYLYHYQDLKTRKRALSVGQLDSTEVRELMPMSAGVVVYAEPGYLLFRRETGLVAQPFDATTQTLTGSPIPILDNVGFNAITYQGLFSASADGVLIALPATPASHLVWFDREGRRTGEAAPPGHYNTLCLTPDDRRMVYELADPGTGNIDLWTLDTAPGATPARLTFNPNVDFYPVCGPDGREVLLASLRDGPPNVYRLRLSAPSGETIAIESPQPKIATDWSRDGRQFVYSELSPKTSWDIKVVPAGGGEPVVFADTDADERSGRLSPDGLWMAYGSFESGRQEVYVQPFPPTGAKWQVSKGGGMQPLWQGSRLYYLASDRTLITVDVQTSGGTFSPGTSRTLVNTRITGAERFGQGCQYAVTSDGRRIVVITATDAVVPATVMLNWRTLVN